MSNESNQPTVIALGMHKGSRSYQLQGRELSAVEVERLLADLRKSSLITSCSVSAEIHTQKGVERRLTLQHPENGDVRAINTYVTECLERLGFVSWRNVRGGRE